jgi:hypothetical protein
MISNQKIFLLSLIFLSILIYSCVTQEHALNLSDSSKEPFKTEEEKIVTDSTRMIKRNNKDIVSISFFERFNDTVVLYLNNKKLSQWFIDEKNNPYKSTGYSGLDYSINLKKTANIITLKLVNQKKYIQFSIHKIFPVYMIQRYDGVWYVRALKSQLNLK